MRSFTTAKALCVTVFTGGVALTFIGITAATASAASPLYWCPDRKSDQQYSATNGPGCVPLVEKKETPAAEQEGETRHERQTATRLQGRESAGRRIDIPEQVSRLPRLLQDRSLGTSAGRRNGRRGRRFTQVHPGQYVESFDGLARHHAPRNDPACGEGPSRPQKAARHARSHRHHKQRPRVRRL